MMDAASKILGSFFLCALIASCATTVNIETSKPGSEVYAGDKLIGRTPIVVSAEALAKAQTPEGYLFRIEGKTHNRLWVLLPAVGRRLDVQIKLEPFEQRKFADDVQQQSATDIPETLSERLELNKDTLALLSLQSSLMLEGSVDTESLERLRSRHPDAGSVDFLEFMRLVRAGDRVSAKTALVEATRKNPLDRDFIAVYNSFEVEDASVQEEKGDRP